MDQDVDLPKTTAFPVRTARVDGNGTSLPLAEARNRAAEFSRSESIVFLDVDCIPSASMIDRFQSALRDDDRLWMGSARYLPANATDGQWKMDDLSLLARPHPLQPDLDEGERQPSEHYEMFWSLCFAIRKSTFQQIGGFDGSFDGYGGEDTDFAFAARHAGVSFGFLGAVAYHQHHKVCKPPLNHFDAIVRNAMQFREKWGVWPMESWLNAFARMGLLQFDIRDDTLSILRKPLSEEIDAAAAVAPYGF
ncbi:glycosyltransferase family 2 protein [Allorhodopirellula solitaria]|uniref:Galactosyltransferase C-terminal domain-containing protein n=1 Tax=Allorhodopirellula solitaria TaxID=2527987 RepID=A0A5C5XUR2_9BACT|nr:galactosyltransferase-related protein [Allorhodopirellula solitaria]TWT66133.1 hypothetical protein CA85_29970 [Allorhodopirellula solitaria]